MTKLFKNSKSILSFVLAFAVLAVSLFTGVVIHSDAAAGTVDLLDSNAEINCANRVTITWDGSVATGIATGSGEKNNPYVIKSASELAWLVQQKADVTTGKYYEIDETIGAIVLQSADKADAIKALDSAAATKAFFEDGEFLKWKEIGVDASAFCGTFDGNGATVYGLYMPSTSSAGLFTTIDAGATIKNIAVKNSYINSSGTGYYMGAIAATTTDDNNGAKNRGAAWIDGCVVADCYMRSKGHHLNSGLVFGGSSYDAVIISNCLVYGNDAYASSDYSKRVTLRGNPANGANTTSAIIPEGLDVVCSVNTTLIANTIRNCVVFGADAVFTPNAQSWRRNDPSCFEYVYTDMPGLVNGGITNGGAAVIFTEAQIKVITANDLSTTDFGDAWFVTDTYPELKSFHDEVFDTTVQKGADGHTVSCSCGLGASSLEPHRFITDVEPAERDSYYCGVCGYVCNHEGGVRVDIEGDCVTQPGYTFDCEACGYHEEDLEDAGHNFTFHEAKAGADCRTEGTIAYNSCDVCGKNYAADADESEPFENAITDLSDGVVGPCASTATTFEFDVNGHFKNCDLCGVKVEEAAHTGDATPHGAAGHAVECDICDFVDTEAPHVFGDDSKCDTCEWECTNHVWVDDGEPVELGMEATPEACKKQAQKCEICGIAGEDKIFGHTTGDWETPWMDRNFIPACTSDGQHTEVLICQDCFFQVDMKIVTDAKTGHSFVEYEEVAPTCTQEGTIAYKQCEVCWNCFAMDAADDEANENALDQWTDLPIPVDPEKHIWAEVKGSDATCDEDGVVAHKFCLECKAFVVNGEDSGIVFDDAKFFERDEETYEAIGIGAKLEDNFNKIEAEAFADYIAENYADQGFELVEYPENPEDTEAMDAYYAAKWEVEMALYELDAEWNEAWGEYQMAAWEAAQAEAIYEYLLAEAEEAGIELVAPAKGHTIVEVKEVAATYDKEGTKAHYACECGKLYSDAEGKNEVTAESLVIAKLVKEDKPAGDGSTTSPITGESVASVAAVAALVGAAFVLVRKSKKA